jgi:hypothetical protein
MSDYLDVRGNTLQPGDFVSFELGGILTYGIINHLKPEIADLTIVSGKFKGAMLRAFRNSEIMRHQVFTTHDLGETMVEIK